MKFKEVFPVIVAIVIIAGIAGVFTYGLGIFATGYNQNVIASTSGVSFAGTYFPGDFVGRWRNSQGDDVECYYEGYDSNRGVMFIVYDDGGMNYAGFHYEVFAFKGYKIMLNRIYTVDYGGVNYPLDVTLK